jgi:phosphatidylglycerophosphatase A
MRIARFIAAGFGSGYVPKIAGTAGSAAAVLIGAPLLALSPLALALAAALATVGGFLAIRSAAVQGDPNWVVIDEFAGQWITMLALGRPTLAGLVTAFLLFRVLDITKLGPIGWADRQHGAFGIMADDVIAGVIGALILALARWLLPNLLT